MNPQSIVILAVLCVLIILAVWYTARRKKRGTGCCGDCTGCGKSCAERKKR